MSKDISRRSSMSGSAQASLPPADGTDSPPQDPPQPVEPSSTTHRSPSPAGDAPNPTEPDMPSAPAAESQPMTASNSSSSSPPPNNTTESTTAGAVPYGTRSRNRTGAARPNYAEDKEIDLEFELPPPTKETNGRKSSRGADQSPAPQAEAGRATSNARRAGNDPAQSVTVQGHYKDQIPGTSTFSANLTAMATPPSQPPTKKRKAASASQSQSHTPTPGQSLDLATRKGGPTSQVWADYPVSNMMSFENCGSRLKDNKLVADDGTVLELNDHAYLVCEPPGESYYLGRIMEFLHVNNDKTQPIDALRLNWYYRPKDIGRKVNDTRQIFASMHSDISPLTALRGKIQIKHKSEVDNLDEEVRKIKDCFWYEKLYDRYIHRYYDVIPTPLIINVPTEVKKVLDERWKYIVVEPSRGKELTSAVKSCKRCSKYCANNASVDCAVCRNTYHMSCVNPPLLKKPSRGFAWACGPCSKAQEKRLESRNTPTTSDAAGDGDDDDFPDEEDDFGCPAGDSVETGDTSRARSTEPELAMHAGTAEQIHQAGMWLFRYLGVHCRVEDALDYDDRIYPRASSRLGPRHQANVFPWPGRPVEYVKAAEVKRKYGKGGYQKKDTKFQKESAPASDTDKGSREERPKWVMDQPPGYIARGEDHPNDDPKNTAKLLYHHDSAEIALAESFELEGEVPDESSIDNFFYEYMEQVKKLAKPLGLPELSTNLLDIGLEMLHANGYAPERALEAISTVQRKAFKEPDLSPAELKRFEDGVAKFGSEWHSIKNHVKSVKAGDIVRFYYTWKKTDRGKQIWGNYSGRKGKKEAKKLEPSEGKLQDDVAHDHDDSAFDCDKAFERKKGFQCKFCSTQNSRQWRRAPNTPPGTLVTENSNGKTSAKDKGPQLLVALCWRCAELWRRYAIQWEDIEDVAKKVSQTGGRAWKRKIDEELYKELVIANELMGPMNSVPSASLSANGTPAPVAPSGPEPPRKKLKATADKDSDPSLDSGSVATAGPQRKKAVAEKPSAPPPAPELPKPRLLPCAVCDQMDPVGERFSCKDCRMTVHRGCYGISENRSPNKWICDSCANDRSPLVSIKYECVLCTVAHTEHDFAEPPKHLGKKKNEKDRERDRLDRENAQRAADYFRKKQVEMNKPTNPREALKRTMYNNWVHVTCAAFTPEIKFGQSKAMEPVEGVLSALAAKNNDSCKICKQKSPVSFVGCHTCRAQMHVECAHKAGCILGFDIAPVKGSRRDQFNIVTIGGETGTMTAAVWCKEHAPTKTIVHRMNDAVQGKDMNVLQLYVQTYKQADLGQSGTQRKANIINQSTKAVNAVASNPPTNRRASTATNNPSTSVRGSVSHIKVDESLGETISVASGADKTCITCSIDVSPKWWPALSSSGPSLSNGDSHHTNDLALSRGPASDSGAGHIALAAAALNQNGQHVSNRFQCHKCHWKKLRKEPTPPPTPAPQREESRPPIPPPISGAHMPDANPPSTAPPYGWPQPPTYPANGPYNNWPHQPPAPPPVAPVHQLNGHHSPHMNVGGQPQFRQPAQMVQPAPPVQPVQPHQQVQMAQPAQQGPHAQPISHSPHLNGQMPQSVNGFPPSPHHGMSSSSHNMQNGPYASFASTRPTPQHLTNGGPPPRAPEHPFAQGNTHSHPPPPPFGLPPHGSPPMQREPNPQGREPGSQQNGSRPSDGRVNGGASASPSLRNLLS